MCVIAKEVEAVVCWGRDLIYGIIMSINRAHHLGHQVKKANAWAKLKSHA